MEGYLKWVEERVAVADEAILILVDGRDMAWGGCSVADLVARYHTIVAASGGPKVVVGADNQVFPPAPWDYLPFKSRRRTVQSAFGISAANFSPANPRFVNSGFIMGPAPDLLRLLRCTKDHAVEPGVTWMDDQYGVTYCMIHNPDLITIDYSTSLSLQLADARQDIVERRDGTVFNTAVSATQCFIHGNGQSLVKFWDIMFPTQHRFM